MSALQARWRLRWRFFWSRRSRGRSAVALMFALVALVAAVYLVLPQGWRLFVGDALIGAVRSMGALGLGALLGGGAILCLALSLALVVAPGYRKHAYLATAPSIIPQVSVYLDAENQLSAATVRPFMDVLIKYLDGRRADLLYFLDASQAATSAQYKTLYRFGFRPVDVPHDPTGEGSVKEAVDKEMSMHAYERALLGPPNQEFIIVTGDRDFVHLVYRLAALGHRVQVWASPIRPAYRTLGTYLDVGVLDLTQILSEPELKEREQVERQTSPKRRRRSRERPSTEVGYPAAAEDVGEVQPPARAAASSAPRDSARDVLDLSGERAYYRAISATLKAYDEVGPGRRGIDRKKPAFRSKLGGQLALQLAEVGYSAGKWIDCWIDHLIAVGIFRTDGDSDQLERGHADAGEGAARMFAMAQAAATAAAQIAARRADGLVRMHEVALALASAAGEPSGDAAAPLRRLLIASGPKSSTHTRYFVRGARALGLIRFEDVGQTLDAIRGVSLPVEETSPAAGDRAGPSEPGSYAPTTGADDGAERSSPAEPDGAPE